MKKAGVISFALSFLASLGVGGLTSGDAFVFDKEASGEAGNNSIASWESSSSATSSSGETNSSNTSDSSSSNTTNSSSTTEPIVNYYKLSKTNKYSTSVTYHIVDMTLSSIYQLQTHLVTVNGKAGYGNSYKKTLSSQWSDIAATHEPIAAINGDFAFYNSSMERAGYVIRNGLIYRSSRRSDYNDYDDMVISYTGSVSSVNEADTTAEKLKSEGAYQVFDFGPALVNDSSISIATNEEVDQSMGSNPRTAFGYLSPLHYLFFVSEGRLSRNSSKDGFTLYEVASILKDYGCSYAYNLDGGGSSTMLKEGTLMNKTCNDYSSHTTERAISDCIYVCKS
jgi:exopolysaccharide biosynthesis protein